MTHNTKRNLSISAVAALGVVTGALATTVASNSILPARAQSSFSECKSLAISTSGFPRKLDGWTPVGAANSGTTLYTIVCR